MSVLRCLGFLTLVMLGLKDQFVSCESATINGPGYQIFGSKPQSKSAALTGKDIKLVWAYNTEINDLTTDEDDFESNEMCTHDKVTISNVTDYSLTVSWDPSVCNVSWIYVPSENTRLCGGGWCYSQPVVGHVYREESEVTLYPYHYCPRRIYRLRLYDRAGHLMLNLTREVKNEVPERPSSPRNIRVVENDVMEDNINCFIALNWTKPDCPEDAEFNYTIVRYEGSSGSSRAGIYPVDPDDETKAVIENLNPWTVHYFVIISCLIDSQVLCSESDRIWETTRVATPSEPRNLMFNVSSTSVELEWNRPYKPRGPLNVYQITFQLRNPRHLSDPRVVRGSASWENYLSNDLIPWRQYEVKVAAVNHDYTGRQFVGEEATLLLETPIGVPKKPNDVRMTINSTSELDVQWTPIVPVTGPTIYLIQLDEALPDLREGCGREEYLDFNRAVRMGHLDGWDSDQITFDDLKPHHCYRARVISETEAGAVFSDYSDIYQTIFAN